MALEIILYLIILFGIFIISTVVNRLSVRGMGIMLMVAIASLVKVDVVVIFAILFSLILSIVSYYEVR